MSMEMVDKFDYLVVAERAFVVNGCNECPIAAAIVGVSGNVFSYHDTATRPSVSDKAGLKREVFC